MKEKLVNGINALGLDADETHIEKLLGFVALLKKWNKIYNLTALKTETEFLELHILDSLTIVPYVSPATRVLDVGSGAGLPGIPLAIMLPEVNFVLLDSNGKKTRFIQQVIIDLKLKNCSVVQKRIEECKPELKFDTLITRAFAEINVTLERLKHFSTEELRLLFMKSKSVNEELKELDKTYHAQCITLKVPGLEADRSLVILSRK